MPASGRRWATERPSARAARREVSSSATRTVSRRPTESPAPAASPATISSARFAAAASAGGVPPARGSAAGAGQRHAPAHVGAVRKIAYGGPLPVETK